MVANPKPRVNKQAALNQQSPLNLAAERRDATVLPMVSRALSHGDCFLLFQPVMRADNQSVPGFHEGFIRIMDETGRVIPASEFMGEAESHELGREIDTWALKLGCKTLQAHPDLRLSINMSARSIGYQPWKKTLNWWLRENPDIGPRLILDMTEQSVMQMPEIVIKFMKELQPHGICFALDDFGSGATSLRHFRDFMFDIVKIDGQFIRGIAHNPDNQVLVEAMRDIAEKFDMLCLAEMVEDAEDAQFLIDLGVDCLQGFYFGPLSRQPTGLASSPP